MFLVFANMLVLCYGMWRRKSDLEAIKHVNLLNKSGVFHQIVNKASICQTQCQTFQYSNQRPSRRLDLLFHHPKKIVEYDPRKPTERFIDPLTSTEIDVLADITNGNCGIVVLMR